MKDKKKINIIAGVFLLVLLTIGVTYAFFSYIGNGSTENTISSDSITFLYEEIDQQGSGISITNAVPIEDNVGKQGQAFNFRIISNTNTNISIPYEINVRQKEGTDDIGDIVKLYLTKVDNNNNETEVELSKYSELRTVTKNNHQEKQLHIDKVPASDSEYNQRYRLRMWIDSEANFSDGSKNNKTFAVTVNVYSSGHVQTQEDIEAASNANVQDINIGGVELDKVENQPYDYFAYSSNSSIPFEVVTENPYASVVIEKTDSTYTNVIAANTGIQKISSTTNLNLSDNDNYFRITIIPEDTTANRNIVKLKITKIDTNYTFTFNYNGTTGANGSEQKVVLPQGKYKLETWGAQGGDSKTKTGGYGAYTVGVFSTNTYEELYINVGGKGGNNSNYGVVSTQINGGYNGGGNVVVYTACCSDHSPAAGGGATHIATVSGLLKNLADYKDTGGTGISDEILIVSGAGGGAFSHRTQPSTDTNGASAVGIPTNTTSFGAGLSHSEQPRQAGGSGYYGGFNGRGGSSYIASSNLSSSLGIQKAIYCYGCSESTSVDTYTVSTTGESALLDTANCPSGYSSNPISKCAKAGNGYAKITYLGN